MSKNGDIVLERVKSKKEVMKTTVTLLIERKTFLKKQLSRLKWEPGDGIDRMMSKRVKADSMVDELSSIEKELNSKTELIEALDDILKDI